MTTSIKAMMATSLFTIVTAGLGPHSWAADRPSELGSPASTVVQFGDLNTSTLQGIQKLYARLRAAAVQVCDSQATWYPTEYWSKKECAHATLDNLVARLNLPRLTALHRESAHGTLPETPVVAVQH